MTDAERVAMWPKVPDVRCTMCRRRATCTWTLTPSPHCLCDECLEGVRL